MIAVNFSMPDLSARLLRHRAAIYSELIVAMQTNRGLLFQAEGSYNGHTAWHSLLLRAGQILANRGVLKKSIAPGTGSGMPGPDGIARFDPATGEATVGTALPYARMMNDGTTKLPGGVLRAKPGHALKIPLPSGKKASDVAKELRPSAHRIHNERTEKDESVIFRKSVKIPARPFDTITEQDAAEFREALKAAIAEALRG